MKALKFLQSLFACLLIASVGIAQSHLEDTRTVEKVRTWDSVLFFPAHVTFQNYSLAMIISSLERTIIFTSPDLLQGLSVEIQPSNENGAWLIAGDQ